MCEQYQTFDGSHANHTPQSVAESPAQERALEAGQMGRFLG
ncbi:hypothetical protein D1BOALGB6SA_7418 [Olavius sp. associated proteobacterium Delta 1]|nr:hypothetical protein D1BOALGB6SA_7418 [Olavius sp. associated proteobacterium Delta 1]